MMLTEAEKLDVLDDDHLVVGHAKRRAVEHVIDVLVIPAREELKRLLETFRRFAQPFAIGVFANDFDHLADVTSDGVRVERFAVVAIIQQDFFGRKSLEDRKSTRLNSSHITISYAVFCLKKKKQKKTKITYG